MRFAYITACVLCILSTKGADAADQAANKAAVEQEAKKQVDSGVKLPLNVKMSSMNICASSPVPAGWIKVNDAWNPTICGNPTVITYNVVTITQYSNRPVGSTLIVCSDAPTPNNWVEVNNSWNPTTCGHPTSITNNVKVIRRVN